MNLVTARDLESADLLALAQLDHNGAHCRSGPPRSQPGRPDPANDRGHAAVADLHLLLTYRPVSSGEHSAGGSAGLHPAVPAAAPG